MTLIRGFLVFSFVSILLSCAIAKSPALHVARGTGSNSAAVAQVSENIFSNDGQCVDLDTKVAGILNDHDYKVYLSGLVVLAQGSTPTKPVIEPDDTIQKAFLKKAVSLTNSLKKQGQFDAIAPGLENLQQDACNAVKLANDSSKSFKIDSDKLQTATTFTGRGRNVQTSHVVNNGSGTITLTNPSTMETWKINTHTNTGTITVENFRKESIPDCNITTPHWVRRNYVAQYGSSLERGMVISLDLARNLLAYGIVQDKTLQAFVKAKQNTAPLSKTFTGVKETVYNDAIAALKSDSNCTIPAATK